jgi:hypothetical protein
LALPFADWIYPSIARQHLVSGRGSRLFGAAANPPSALPSGEAVAVMPLFSGFNGAVAVGEMFRQPSAIRCATGFCLVIIDGHKNASSLRVYAGLALAQTVPI